MLNGQERFAPQPLGFFTEYQVNKHHSGEGSRIGIKGESYLEFHDYITDTINFNNEHGNYFSGSDNNSNINSGAYEHIGNIQSTLAPSIGVYSFALRPEGSSTIRNL